VKLHKFIWNNNKEIIKRNTVILPYNEGGLNMFNLECRLKTIHIKQFIYISHKIESMFYFMSIYWMKFELKEKLSKNLNIIACGNESERTEYYKRMIVNVNYSCECKINKNKNKILNCEC